MKTVRGERGGRRQRGAKRRSEGTLSNHG